MTETTSLIRNLLVFATLLPLVSSVVVLFTGKRILHQAAGWLATAVMGLSFVCSVVSLQLWLAHQPQTILWNLPWIPLPGSDAGWLYLGAMIDGLTVAMMTMPSMENVNNER